MSKVEQLFSLYDVQLQAVPSSLCASHQISMSSYVEKSDINWRAPIFRND